MNNPDRLESQDWTVRRHPFPRKRVEKRREAAGRLYPTLLRLIDDLDREGVLNDQLIVDVLECGAVYLQWCWLGVFFEIAMEGCVRRNSQVAYDNSAEALNVTTSTTLTVALGGKR